MKKILTALLITLFTTVSAKSQNPDFRAFAWGSSFAQVQAGETAKLVAKVSDDELLYADVLGGYDCDVIYTFTDNNKLASGMYVFTRKYSNPQFYLEDYKIFKSLLTKKYGKAVADNEIWKKSTPVYDKKNYGQAVSDGMLSLNAAWITPRSDIKISLITLDNHPSLQIYYTSVSLDELQNMDVINNALKKL